MMAKETNESRGPKRDNAHRLLGGTQVQRFVRSLEFYKVGDEQPKNFDRLLARLDAKSRRN